MKVANELDTKGIYYFTGLSPMARAVIYGEIELVQQLLNEGTALTDDLLFYAIHENDRITDLDGLIIPGGKHTADIRMIRYLLSKGANPAVASPHNNYSFMSKLIKTGEIELFVELAEDNPQLLDQRTHINQSTLLHIAAFYDELEFAQYILRQRPQFFHAKTQKGYTPLMAASRFDAPLVAAYLLTTATAFEAITSIKHSVVDEHHHDTAMSLAKENSPLVYGLLSKYLTKYDNTFNANQTENLSQFGFYEQSPEGQQRNVRLKRVKYESDSQKDDYSGTGPFRSFDGQ